MGTKVINNIITLTHTKMLKNRALVKDKVVTTQPDPVF